MLDGARQPGSVAEQRRLLAAQRAGDPFLVFRDGSDTQHIVVLPGDVVRIAVGRRETADVALAWDERVSRTHAELERIGSDWTIADDGLSRNGTFVNEQRVASRRRLADGDVVRVGHTTLAFHDPGSGKSQATVGGGNVEEAPPITPAQLRVLVALCRPCLTPGVFMAPAPNDRIAAELFLTIDAVKAHLRQLFRLFELDGLPQIQKRVALVRVAIESGVVRRSPD